MLLAYCEMMCVTSLRVFFLSMGLANQYVSVTRAEDRARGNVFVSLYVSLEFVRFVRVMQVQK